MSSKPDNTINVTQSVLGRVMFLSSSIFFNDVKNLVKLQGSEVGTRLLEKS
jgi:hypothetical protein